jgi:hypothetical protein
MESSYRTSSMPAAACAGARGAGLPRLEPTTDPRRFELCFDQTGEISRSISGYCGGEFVPSRDFYRVPLGIRFTVNRAKSCAR